MFNSVITEISTGSKQGILDLHEEMHNIQQILFYLWKSESLSEKKTFA